MVAFVLFLYMISPLISPKPLKLNGAHVVVSAPVSFKQIFHFYAVYIINEKINNNNSCAAKHPSLDNFPY